MTGEIANNDIWNKIEKGEITGFSMGGVANFSKEDKELENLNKQEESKKGLFKQLAEAFGLHVVEKSGKKMSNKNKETLQNIYENMGRTHTGKSRKNGRKSTTKSLGAKTRKNQYGTGGRNDYKSRDKSGGTCTEKQRFAKQFKR